MKITHDFLGDFSLKWPEKLNFPYMSYRKLCMGQKGQKLQIQDLLNEVYPKGLIFKMTLFSSIDLDRIIPKKSKIMKLI